MPNWCRRSQDRYEHINRQQWSNIGKTSDPPLILYTHDAVRPQSHAVTARISDMSQRIKLFQGTENSCGYLPDRKAVNIYADPHHPNPGDVYNQLISRGFRRSGEFIYRPGCPSCKACVPVRILVEKCHLRRTDRRNLKLNTDLVVRYCKARYTSEFLSSTRVIWPVVMKAKAWIIPALRISSGFF